MAGRWARAPQLSDRVDRGVVGPGHVCGRSRAGGSDRRHRAPIAPASRPATGDARANEAAVGTGSRQCGARRPGAAPVAPRSEPHPRRQQHAAAWPGEAISSHQSPNGRDPRDRYLANGGNSSKLIAENIARCTQCGMRVTRATIEQLTQDWMNSPEHRATYCRATSTASVSARPSTTSLVSMPCRPLPALAGRCASAANPAPLRLPSEQMARALDRLNAARGEAHATPLVADEQLEVAAADHLPDAGAQPFALPDTESVLRAIATSQPDRWLRSGLWRRVQRLRYRAYGDRRRLFRPAMAGRAAEPRPIARRTPDHPRPGAARRRQWPQAGTAVAGAPALNGQKPPDRRPSARGSRAPRPGSRPPGPGLPGSGARGGPVGVALASLPGPAQSESSSPTRTLPPMAAAMAAIGIWLRPAPSTDQR